MCGIAGFLARPGTQIDIDALDRMERAILHRGPDGRGAFEARGVGLRHTRLSIIDLEGGAQPLIHDRLALVANGEIYNDPLLRQDLSYIAFKTGSDCEAPLYLWPWLGAHHVDALRGMYAIAFVDQGDEVDRAALSRDPFGIRPLYYVETRQGIAFASEPQALIAGGYAAASCRPEAVTQLLQTQFVAGSETIFLGIRRARPGETLVVENGAITSRQFKPAIEGDIDRGMTEEAALKALDKILLDSVAVHQRADVPSGLFLSGGVDSAAILAAMVRLDSRRPVAWTARFDTGPVDEAAAARRMAAACGAAHEVITITERMFWEDLPKIVACMDDPVADYAIIPTWFLARAARRDLTVVLSGEGGDELFGGYGRYRRACRPWWRGGRAPRCNGIMSAVLPKWKDTSWKTDLSAAPGDTRFRAAQRLDIATWLPDDLLIKLDRCLMAHGMEGRTPLLDVELARLAWRLPDRLKTRHGQGKYLLRKWLDQQCSQADAFAPKQGFTVPVGAWMAAQAARLGPLLHQQAALKAAMPGVDIGAIVQKTGDRKARKAAWVLLFYALWHRIHIEGVPCDGDVDEVLAS
ncbi:asparagine synthase (glutamine-hydrolyzing) [Sorlinia euscelidii]|uniref:asparagine synthase (glutamine-hydrolyzing) n=1 Tax=Sorlinia euscelidii TaxID=3081148 RepID=A0ABU7U5C8_9PROT